MMEKTAKVIGFLSKATSSWLLLPKSPIKTFIEPKCIFMAQNNIQIRYYAARKGKRDKLKAAKKKQKKEEVVKESFMQKYLKSKKKIVTLPGRYTTDKLLENPIDDVYRQKLFIETVYSFSDAINLLKEIHHPTMYNAPDITVQATVELDTRLPKKNRYMEKIHGFLKFPHDINIEQERKILAVCENADDQIKAMDAGAWLSGGKEIIKRIQDGELTIKDFDYLVAHVDIIMELAKVRGLLKTYFPNKSKGNIGKDMTFLVEKFVKGIEFASSKHPIELDFQWIEVPIGQLNMPIDHLENNFNYLLNAIYEYKPSGNIPGSFITRTLLFSRISGEKFSVSPWKYLQEEEEEEKIKDAQ